MLRPCCNSNASQPHELQRLLLACITVLFSRSALVDLFLSCVLCHASVRLLQHVGFWFLAQTELCRPCRWTVRVLQ